MSSVTAIVLCAAVTGWAEGAEKVVGEWRQLRGDRGLTGRCDLKGRIGRPEVAWKQFIGARETVAAVRFDGTERAEQELASADRAAALEEVQRQWGIAAPVVDVDGEVVPPGMGGRTGKFLRGRAGLQRIEFEVDERLGGYCRLMAREAGRWVEVWRSERVGDQMQGLNTITGDFDGDGRLEVAFTPWHRLWVLDLETGKTEGTGGFYQPDALGDGRGYGWLGAFDLTGDGRSEFVIISDTQAYISVLGLQGERFGLLWGRKYKSKSEETRGSSLSPGTHPVQDVDGDGVPEIVVASYDERRTTSRWESEIIDGATGRTRHTLVGEQIAGVADLDGDGAAELLTSNATGERMRVSIFGIDGGKLVRRWQLDDASFQMHRLPYLPPNVANGAAAGNETALVGEADGDRLQCFVTRQVVRAGRSSSDGQRTIALDLWRAGRAGVVRVGRVTGPMAEALAVRSENGVPAALIGTQSPGGAAQLDVAGGTARIVASRHVAAPLSPPVVGRLAPDTAPAIVVQEAAEHVVALDRPGGGREPRLRWRRFGRGMHEGDAHRSGGTAFAGVNLVDVNGDGRLATVAGTRGQKDQARLVALDPAGRELWHRDYDDLPGHPPGFTLPGLSFWFAGRFVSPEREDLIVATKAGVLTRLTLLDARSGTPGWSQVAGGMYMAVYDHDGNGLDDALTTCWSEIRVLRGNTGATLLHLNTAMEYFGQGKVWPADAYCCAADLRGTGRPQIIYWPAYAARGVVEHTGRLIWEEFFTPRVPLTENPYAVHVGQNSIHPAIGDFDGDGQLELISGGDYAEQGGGELVVRCYDAATGRHEWLLPLEVGGPARSAMSADIDGDGRDEAIFSRGNTLCAVGTTPDGSAGAVRWTLPFPAALGPPTIADSDGDGLAEILVVADDGYLYCIDGTQR